MFRRLVASLLCLSFIASSCPPVFAQEFSVNQLPVPGSMISVSPSFTPALIKGLTVHQDNPFLFDFIVDPGQSKISKEVLKDESMRMIKYFFASLTLPDKDIWVNLSPYEKDRMIPESLGVTAMGRDLLAQDYMLKQLTASLIYPQKELGKEFWARVYSKAKEMYGTTQMPVNTFNKVWIVPQKAGVYEHGQTAYIVSSHLKVMLEEDYLSLTKHTAISNAAHSVASQIIRQIILPEIEKEINTGANFATLRQIFYAQVLAVWFKRNLKQALLNRVYANKSTVKGIDQNDTATNEAIYHQYLKAYKKGVFNYIKEDIDPVTQEVLPRKYFSGGYSMAQIAIEPESLSAAMTVAEKAKAFKVSILALGKRAADRVTLQVNAIAAGLTSTGKGLILNPSAAMTAQEFRIKSLEAASIMMDTLNTPRNADALFVFNHSEKEQEEARQAQFPEENSPRIVEAVRGYLKANWRGREGQFVQSMPPLTDEETTGKTILEIANIQFDIAANEIAQYLYFDAISPVDYKPFHGSIEYPSRGHLALKTYGTVVDLTNIHAIVPMQDALNGAISDLLNKMINNIPGILQARYEARKALTVDNKNFVTLSLNPENGLAVRGFFAPQKPKPGVAIIDLGNNKHAEQSFREAFENALKQVLLTGDQFEAARLSFISAMGKKKLVLKFILQQDGSYRFVIVDAAMRVSLIRHVLPVVAVTAVLAGGAHIIAPIVRANQEAERAFQSRVQRIGNLRIRKNGQPYRQDLIVEGNLPIISDDITGYVSQRKPMEKYLIRYHPYEYNDTLESFLTSIGADEDTQYREFVIQINGLENLKPSDLLKDRVKGDLLIPDRFFPTTFIPAATWFDKNDVDHYDRPQFDLSGESVSWAKKLLYGDPNSKRPVRYVKLQLGQNMTTQGEAVGNLPSYDMGGRGIVFSAYLSPHELEAFRRRAKFNLGTSADLNKILQDPEKYIDLDGAIKNSDKLSKADKASTTPLGGIDLSQIDSAIHVEKDANGGVKVMVDQALIARIEREGGMTDVEPVFINMQPANIKALFGAGI